MEFGLYYFAPSGLLEVESRLD